MDSRTSRAQVSGASVSTVGRLSTVKLSTSLRIQATAQAGESILEEADRLINGPRQAAYSSPIDDYDCTGRLWAATLESYFRFHGHPDFRCPDIPAEIAT